MADVSTPADRDEVRARIGRLGVWSLFGDRIGARAAQRFAREVESVGYRVIFIAETVISPDVMAHAAILLGATEGLVVGTGIANIWARDPVAMRNGERALLDVYPDRFILGLGVSHLPAVKRRGGDYDRPLERMREYLDAMDAARYAGPEPASKPVRLLAALGPKMLDLALARTDGAHPYFVPVAHTSLARERLGPGPLLVVEQAVVLEPDGSAAREVAREHMKGYLRLDNYANNLRRLGFAEDDLAGPSDRLVDAIVAHGDAGALATRVRDHWERGADHVCVQALGPDPLPALRALRRELPEVSGDLS